MTHLFAILDRSGSMSGLEHDTIEGYNGFIKNLKGEDARVTLTIFDTHFETPYADKPVSKVPALTNKVYFPRGGTALIDAVCGTINDHKKDVKRGDKALVLIITDGYENSSREYTSAQMKALISSLEKRKNWTFTYLGANQDAWGVAQKWGFNMGNVSTYNATRGGTQAAFQTMSVNSHSFVAQSAGSSKSFYADDKDKLKDAK